MIDSGGVAGVHTARLGALHTAYLDALTGEGLLVLPRADEDVRVDYDATTGRGSLARADWRAALRTLDALGWEPSEDDDGEAMNVGTTREGRAVIGLYGREPITADPSVSECATAWQGLAALAGLDSRGDSPVPQP